MEERYQTNRAYLLADLDSDVRQGEKARQTMVDYINGRGGIAHALEWATGHVITDAKAKVAEILIEKIKQCDDIDTLADVADDYRKMASAELSYMSLGNNQLVITGQLAKCQALRDVSIKLDAFVRFMRKED